MQDAPQPIIRIRRQLVPWPTSHQAATAQDGHWVCLPWTTDLIGDINKLPRWDQQLGAYKVAAAAGISPHFHGSALVCSSSDKELYNRVKYVTGILLSCNWLRDLVCAELLKLHASCPHKLNPVGVIVISRVPHSLQTYPDPQQLMPHASELQEQLDKLNWSCLEHGLLNTGIKPSNIGIELCHGDYKLQLLNWTEHYHGICLAKLPSSNHRDAITLCVNELTRGIVDDALSRRVQQTKASRPRGLLDWVWC
jgi:hypothetical protein